MRHRCVRVHATEATLNLDLIERRRFQRTRVSPLALELAHLSRVPQGRLEGG